MSIIALPQAATGRPRNNLLCALRADDYQLIQSRLEHWSGQAGELLYDPGDNVETIYFPCGSAVASFLITSEDGRDVETVLIGREGAVGGIVSHGHLPAFTRIRLQVGGTFMKLGVADLEAAKRRSLTLRNFFARYADCLLAQVFQSTACNAIHTIEQRAAKWIIATMERTGEPSVLLTQEQLAVMLGVGRSYASRVMQVFRSESILETRRGAIAVRDAAALQRRACRCNDAVKGHFEAVLAGVYPTEESATA
jgi:CRP-like cAMP-binding protein